MTRAVRKYTVWWREHASWTPYQTGLSRARADRLALQVKLKLSPDAPTLVLPDGALLPDGFSSNDAQDRGFVSTRSRSGNASPDTGKGRDWWWWGVIENQRRR